MRHSLQSHIIYLEEKIQSLRDRLTNPHLNPDEHQGLKAQVFHAELALEHYREAYALELSVSSPEPPNGPATRSDGSGTPERSKPEKKKEGLTGTTARARKKARVGFPAGIPAHNRAMIRCR